MKWTSSERRFSGKVRLLWGDNRQVMGIRVVQTPHNGLWTTKGKTARANHPNAIYRQAWGDGAAADWRSLVQTSDTIDGQLHGTP
jgi:hypothetical protein